MTKKMKFKFLAPIIISIFIVTMACENAKKDNQDSTTKTELKEASNESENKIDLDNGKRWIANQETTEGINAMFQLINSFKETENIDSYKNLADSLNSEFNIILKKCTMKGEAHDQLHNYLFPMKEKFEQLSSNDLSESKNAFEDLKMHVSLYKKYFE